MFARSEAHLWTGHWVSKDLSMTCSDSLDNCIRILVQRQFKDPSAIELLFEEVTRFNLVPSPENYESIIFEATLLVQDGTIYWTPNVGWWPDLQVEMKSLGYLQNDFGGVEWNG